MRPEDDIVEKLQSLSNEAVKKRITGGALRGQSASRIRSKLTERSRHGKEMMGKTCRRLTNDHEMRRRNTQSSFSLLTQSGCAASLFQGI